MNSDNVLNVTESVKFDESISEFEYRSYLPYSGNSLDCGDEIRIPIQNQDTFVIPGESFIYLEGVLDKTSDQTATFVQNAFAFMFEEIRYELGGTVIDEIRNPGITTSIKGYASMAKSELSRASNYGWGETIVVDSSGNFNACVPLSHFLGFAEDFKRPILNFKHELVLLRSFNDQQCITGHSENGKKVKIQLQKIIWKVPHVRLSDEYKIEMLRVINSGANLQIAYRSWNYNELPNLQPSSYSFVWPVRSSSQLEKARWILFALQVDRQNNLTKISSNFDHADLSELQVQLNSVKFPYEPLTTNFDKNQYALAYQAFSSFRGTYYNRDTSGPILTKEEFKAKAPIFFINCTRQEEAIKHGSVEIKIEFHTRKPMPDKTKAFALVLHDRIIEYNPLYQTVKKL